MVVIIDANILISSIISINGNLASIIYNNSSTVSFIIPEFLLTEIKKNQSKICASQKITIDVFYLNLSDLLQHVLIVNDDEIPEAIFKKAFRLTEDIDKNDTIYVAFALALNCLFWTGDIKLYKGLRRKGFNNIISTRELKDIIRGI